MADSNAPAKTKEEVKVDSSDAPASKNKQSIDKIIKEVDHKIELYNGIVYTCFNKCIDRKYREAELYIGENCCLDRCVSKYNQVNNIIGQILSANRPAT